MAALTPRSAPLCRWRGTVTLAAFAALACWMSSQRQTGSPNATTISNIPSAFVPAGRRAAWAGLSLGGAGVVFGGGDNAHGFELESNRVATYNNKARQLQEAADWYLFELRPLVYPPVQLVSKEACERMGDSCPERAGLSVVSTMYQTNGASRGGGGVVLSKLEREFFAPMKILAISTVFDPDTSDDLAEVAAKFERSSAKLGNAATKGDLTLTREKYDEGRDLLNGYFQRVNAEMGLPPKSEFYLVPMPTDASVLENDKYWQRRQERWLVKKKVDAVSKGSKTARFYAKTLFGDDAESWSAGGDRAPEFWK